MELDGIQQPFTGHSVSVGEVSHVSLSLLPKASIFSGTTNILVATNSQRA